MGASPAAVNSYAKAATSADETAESVREDAYRTEALLLCAIKIAITTCMLPDMTRNRTITTSSGFQTSSSTSSAEGSQYPLINSIVGAKIQYILP